MNRLQRRTLLEQMVENLVNLQVTSGKEKLSVNDIYGEADKLGINHTTAVNAWYRYLELDSLDGNLKHGKYVGKDTTAQKKWAKKNAPCNSRIVTFVEAAKIILEVKNNPSTAVYKILKKHKVSTIQYYNWLYDLNVSGHLLGTKVFDWEQYVKKDIKMVISFKRNPNKFSNLSKTEVAKLNLLSKVMDDYLKVRQPKVKNIVSK
jgi:hypothetical protein